MSIFSWLLVALVGVQPPTASHLEKIREAGRLTVVCFPQQDNEFVFVRTAAGPMPAVGDAKHFGGIDVEILQHVADSLGVELAIQPISEPSIGLVFERLLSDAGDVGAGSLTITEARAQRVDFTTPYVPVYEAVIVRPGSDIRKPKDLEGRRVAVLEQSSHHEVLLRRDFPQSHMVFVDFTIAGLVAVQDGEVDFTLVDAFGPDAGIGLPKGLEQAFVLPDEVGGIGMAIRPNSDLLGHINQVIAGLEASGELDAIIARHASWSGPAVREATHGGD